MERQGDLDIVMDRGLLRLVYIDTKSVFQHSHIVHIELLQAFIIRGVVMRASIQLL